MRQGMGVLMRRMLRIAAGACVSAASARPWPLPFLSLACSSLQRLRLNGCRTLSDAALQEMLGSLAQLRELDVSGEGGTTLVLVPLLLLLLLQSWSNCKWRLLC